MDAAGGSAAGTAGTAGADASEAALVGLLLHATALAACGRTDEAEARFDDALARARARGDRLHESVAHANRMFLWSARRQPDRAKDDLRAAMQLAREVGHPLPERVATFNLAEILYWEGEEREALALVRRARRLAERFLDEPAPDELLLEARLQLARGALAEAAVCWRQARAARTLATPSADLLSHLVARVLADAGASVGDETSWDDLLAAAQRVLPGDELLEHIYWRARSALGRGARAEAEATLAGAAARLADWPVWRHRFEELARAAPGP